MAERLIISYQLAGRGICLEAPCPLAAAFGQLKPQMSTQEAVRVCKDYGLRESNQDFAYDCDRASLNRERKPCGTLILNRETINPT